MTIKPVDVVTLKQWLERGNAVVIDVREPAEHKSECIDGACLIPLSKISQEKLPTKSGPIVIHCHSGKRSEDACKKLLSENPNLEVYFLKGGIVAWKEAGYAVKNLGGNVLPLDRQTQLAAGVLAFSGVILGAFVSPGFYVLPGFVGLGLIFAGITGWCGMAKLLAKMPWNQ